ncbi:uncharacterized protein AMSG_08773 [Thecamonas trahens ATCC 50062]|uniref:TAFII55 protein conserved region domain-containing protein n=1 Tax=Thecamonas trahens ATCC 50062 TaxID=461836 RepID=A0A0L0DLZ7_THETB|nr:hypothetical protein AMSG_08773 [Thecamonas trahens ATCC 50062]KNC53280.1 hypothetical protein AMSG_08773 [Thecamonas trahens ATCC 50062]|eukprot:XP_013754544.1 hypothetical protein AMSG_08773 [Thecamonas trahens ATCC 50062]
MVNLPCNVETFRTHDKRMLYKTADVGQALLVHARPSKAADQIRGSLLRSGITPPTQDIRTRFDTLGRSTTWRKAIQIKERVDDIIRYERIKGYKIEVVDADEFDEYGVEFTESYDVNDQVGWHTHYATPLTTSRIILRIKLPNPSSNELGSAFILSEGEDSIIYDGVGAVYIPPEIALAMARERERAQAQAMPPASAPALAASQVHAAAPSTTPVIPSPAGGPALAPAPTPAAPAPATAPAAPAVVESAEATALRTNIADLERKAGAAGNPMIRMRLLKQVAALKEKLAALT